VYLVRSALAPGENFAPVAETNRISAKPQKTASQKTALAGLNTIELF
jgi:hypothetical protein